MIFLVENSKGVVDKYIGLWKTDADGVLIVCSKLSETSVKCTEQLGEDCGEFCGEDLGMVFTITPTRISFVDPMTGTSFVGYFNDTNIITWEIGVWTKIGNFRFEMAKITY